MTCIALEQAHAQQPLKARNSPSDRGLINPKLPRPPSNAARARKQQNVTQVIPIQVLHFCSLIQQTCRSSSIFVGCRFGEALRRSDRPEMEISGKYRKGPTQERAMSAIPYKGTLLTPAIFGL